MCREDRKLQVARKSNFMSIQRASFIFQIHFHISDSLNMREHRCFCGGGKQVREASFLLGTLDFLTLYPPNWVSRSVFYHRNDNAVLPK